MFGVRVHANANRIFVCLFNGIKKKPKGEDCIFVKNKLNKGNLWVNMIPPFFSENFA